MKKSMDLFGQALTDFALGEKYHFIFIEPDGEEHVHGLERYFRKPNQISKLEKKLISLSTGNILDVGCATANYFPLFEKKNVFGIDISPKVISLAQKAGYNCAPVDIFNFNTEKKFDTITFLENNLGMAGTVPNLKKLFKKLDTLLSKDGQILAEAKKVRYKKFSAYLVPKYKGAVGAGFKWLNVNTNYLKKVCHDCGFNCQIIDSNKKYNLLKITRI